MIVRDNKREPRTFVERLKREISLIALAEAEEEISSECFAEQLADLICENAFCTTENKGSKITVKLLNGQIFKLTVQ